MMTIKINPGTENEEYIEATKDFPVEDALRAHGYDPTAVDWTSVKDPEDRLSDLEGATGVGGQGKSGIAHRIDDLEQRISDLEDQV